LTPIELSAPARNLEYGKAAIIHGADAVYIGAPCFSARAGAGNSIADIERTVRFAHLYRAKVYATLNTILYDHEIDAAVRLIRQLYEAGIDALIIQDMGLLQCDLPPVPLFASTQTHNHTPEKVAFLEKAGFHRVILARELSLSQIEAIRRHTDIELECFVHGALCVSYSGQCYMSHAIAGRSGNRGVCAQPCRSVYRLLDANSRTIVDNAHLLSLKDLNLSGHLAALINAGVTSFKIEGRLKDMNYVKNITAFYRRHLDSMIENSERWAKASSGNVELQFTPNPYKTFNRGYTTYFIDGRKEKTASPQTQKSTGERLGRVTQATPQWFTIDTTAAMSHGDGLCWLNPPKGLDGVRVNRVEGKKIFPAKPVHLKPGMEIFRNNDFVFEKILSGNSADRRIVISFELYRHESGYRLCVKDEDGNHAEYIAQVQHIPAKDPATARKQIDRQLRKLGNSVFSAIEVVISDSFDYFIPAAELNEMRRQAIRQLENLRIEHYRAKPVNFEFRFSGFGLAKPCNPGHGNSKPETSTVNLKSLDYRANAANHYAKDFYRQHGVEQIDDAFELQDNHCGKTLMTAKHCIKYQYNMCPVKQCPSGKWKEPLFLKDNRHIYRLEFDCRACEMKVISDSAKT
jgi:putative protease